MAATPLEPLGPVGEEQFDELVSAALDRVPAELAALMDNCVVLVEDRPPADAPDDLLGLYEGIPLTERGEFYSAVLPDQITIYRLSITGACDTEEQVVSEVRTTVVHEVGHHFGIDDERLHELGY